jgi:ankyrin repeat protein
MMTQVILCGDGGGGHESTSSNNKEEWRISLNNAIGANDLVSVNLLLFNASCESNVVDDEDAHGFTPLHQAVCQNRTAIVELLIERGANVSVPSRAGWTPMFYAVRDGLQDMVETLLNKNGDTLVSAPVDYCYEVRPLHVAANFSQPEIGALLLDRGAPIEAKARYMGQNRTVPPSVTALHQASIVSYGMVKLLLERSANVNARDSFDQTPLHLAAMSNKPEIAELLLANGAAIEARAKYSDDRPEAMPSLTPLHLASANLKPAGIAMVKLLLEKGANVSARDRLDRTPLHLATMFEPARNSTDIMEVLLVHGAPIEAKSRKEIVYTAYEADRPDESLPWVTPLLLASNYASIKLLLEKGANFGE